MTVQTGPRWFTSSFSGGSGTECVECALSDDGVLVRDSKNAGGPIVTVEGAPWRAFIRALDDGALSL
ncbi:DUF397 domain-containing protein [Streptomyces sp. NPDC005551]|uniref:DUF397 domain-containing protein n=1 Tax=Streptomyces sp. NPDC005551 TaxID=3364725 RepID=UPI0036C90608